MKALTLTQPWATLVAIGAKSIETRSWSTSHRGATAIHAAKGFPAEAEALCHTEPFRSVLNAAGIQRSDELPRGKVISIAELTNCYRFDEGTLDAVMRGSRRGLWPSHEALFGDFSAGRFGLALGAVQALPRPIAARGMLSLWELPADVEAQIEAQLGVHSGPARTTGVPETNRPAAASGTRDGATQTDGVNS